jgi:hypothetical protein
MSSPGFNLAAGFEKAYLKVCGVQYLLMRLLQSPALHPAVALSRGVLPPMILRVLIRGRNGNGG